MTWSTTARAALSQGFAASTTRGANVVGAACTSISVPRWRQQNSASWSGRNSPLRESDGWPALRSSSSAASLSARYSISTGVAPGRRQADEASAAGDAQASQGHGRDDLGAGGEQLARQGTKVGVA